MKKGKLLEIWGLSFVLVGTFLQIFLVSQLTDAFEESNRIRLQANFESLFRRVFAISQYLEEIRVGDGTIDPINTKQELSRMNFKEDQELGRLFGGNNPFQAAATFGPWVAGILYILGSLLIIIGRIYEYRSTPAS